MVEMGGVCLLPNLRSISLCLPVTCLSCQAVSDTYEAFLAIPLDIKVRCSEIVVLPSRGRMVSPAMMTLSYCPALDSLNTRLIAVRMAWIAFAVFDHAFHRQLW